MSARRTAHRLEPGRLLLVGALLYLLGRTIDFGWHITHDEFERAADQLRAHSLAWLGTLVMLVGAVVGIVQRQSVRTYTAVAAGTSLYAVAAVWHFWEHSQHRDPDLPHVLLALANLLIIGGVAWCVAEIRRRRNLVGSPDSPMPPGGR